MNGGVDGDDLDDHDGDQDDDVVCVQFVYRSQCFRGRSWHKLKDERLAAQIRASMSLLQQKHSKSEEKRNKFCKSMKI